MIQGNKSIEDTDERVRLATIYPKWVEPESRCPARTDSHYCSRPVHDLLMERHAAHDNHGRVIAVWFGTRSTNGHGW